MNILRVKDLGLKLPYPGTPIRLKIDLLYKKLLIIDILLVFKPEESCHKFLKIDSIGTYESPLRLPPEIKI